MRCIIVYVKPLAQHAYELPASGIREIVNLALTMPDVIRLEIGEPNFRTPQHIVDEAILALENGFTRYTHSAGLLSLRTLIAEYSSRQMNLPISADQVTVTLGAMEGIYAALTALIETGDEVLIPGPGFPNVAMAVQTRGGVNVRYPLCIENEFVPRLADLERLVTARTKLLVINSPGNPTGAVFPRAVIHALMDFALRHDLWVLADEVYEQLVFEGEHISPLQFDAERVISVHSFSKTYAMTGWRVGYTITSREMARVLMKIQEAIVATIPAPLQKAAEAALTGSQKCVDEMRATYLKRRDAVLDVLRENDAYLYTPRGAFYMLLDISRAGLPSREFALRLLNEKHVAVAPGSAFGFNGNAFVRVSLAAETGALLEGVRRVCEFVRAIEIAPTKSRNVPTHVAHIESA